MTKLTNPLKSAICNRTERFSHMRRQNAPMFRDDREGRSRFPGGRDAVWEQILKMLLPSAEKLQSAYNT